jgi:hypothetical protein
VLWRCLKQENTPYSEMSIDELAKRGLICPSFCVRVDLRSTFYRNLSAVEIEIVRDWESLDIIAVLQFYRADKYENFNHVIGSGFKLAAVFNEQCLTGVALALRGVQFPESRWPVNFFDYFRHEYIEQREPILGKKPLAKKTGKGGRG